MSISLPLVRRVDRAQIRQVETVRKLGSQLETKRRSEMKFMMIVKHAEKQGPPPKQLMDAIATLAGGADKTCAMLGNGGRGPPAPGARVRLSLWTMSRLARTGSHAQEDDSAHRLY